MGKQESSLAACADCGGTVSKRAMMCPHCGRPFGSGPLYEVTVRDVQMRFGSMVSMLVGMAFAAIPALIILGAVGFFLFAFFAGVFHR